MSIMHKLLEGYLRAVGRERDANEVAASAAPSPEKREESAEEIPPSSSVSEPAPQAPPSVNETHAQSGSRGSAGRAEAAGSEGNHAPSGGSMASGADHSSAGGSASAHGSQEGGAGGEQPSEHPDTAPSAQPAPYQEVGIDPHDPLFGLHSAHLRASLERDAFASASSIAQDSEISRAAQLLPPELRATLTHDIPATYQNATPAARADRIAALKGDMPEWARKDLERDRKPPEVSRTAAARTASRAAAPAVPRVTLREPRTESAKHSLAGIATAIGRATTVPRAASRLDAQPASKSASSSESQPASQPAPVRAPRTADSGREM